MIKILDFTLLLFYCLFIYWLSDQASLQKPFDFGFEYQDKLYHAGAYSIMGLLAWRSFNEYAYYTGNTQYCLLQFVRII
jgi:hypothetical protein